MNYVGGYQRLMMEMRGLTQSRVSYNLLLSGTRCCCEVVCWPVCRVSDGNPTPVRRSVQCSSNVITAQCRQPEPGRCWEQIYN